MPPFGRLRSPMSTCGSSGWVAWNSARTRRSVARSFAVPHRRSGRFGICLRTGSHVSQSALTSGSWTPLTSRPRHGSPSARDGPAGRTGAVVVGLVVVGTTGGGGSGGTGGGVAGGGGVGGGGGRAGGSGAPA